MQIPVLDSNTLIIAILLLAAVYGLAGGKQRLRLLILSVYVGIVLAEQMSAIVKPYAGGLGVDQLNLLLLSLPIVVFGFAKQHSSKSHRPDKGSAIANILVGIMTGGLIVASALRLLPTSELADIDGDSFLAMILQQYQLWLLGALPLVALLMGLIKAPQKHH
jgi:hypothetical protein